MKTRHALLGALLLTCACGPERASRDRTTGGTIVVAAAADVDALIPPLIAQSTGRQVAEQIFDRLADIGDEMNTVGDAGFRPALAERWTWAPDSLSVAFHLRSDARWHDGERVTADDVRFTHQLFADPLVASPTGALLANIDSVTARDSLTAVVWYRAKTPARFFETTYFLFIVPRHLLDTVPRARLRESAFARNPIGSGRFRFSRWEPAVSLEIVADTANYRGRALPDRVVWTVAPDFGAASTRFLSGEADVFEFLRPEQIEEVARRPTLRVLMYGSLDYAFVQFNLRDPRQVARPHPLFADRELRRALSMAVDRAAMVRSVFDTLAATAIGPITRAVPFADSTVPQIAYDTARAAALLNTIGWRDSDGDGVRDRGGRALSFTLLVPSSSRNRVRLAVLLQEQFRKVGVRMDIEQLEFGAFTERSQRGRFDAVFGAWRIDVGPGGIRQTWGTAGARSPNGLNYGSYENATFDGLVDSALTAQDLPTGKRYFRRALEVITGDVPAIWMYEPRAVLGLHRRLRPVHVRPDSWAAGLADWTVDPAQRLDRDGPGVSTKR